MKHKSLILTAFTAAVAGAFAWRGGPAARAQSDDLGVPGFHHLHLLSTNPDLAVAFYEAHFASAKKATWGGMPAISTPNNVLILFTKVDRPPSTSPQTAFWHFGWNVTDERAKLAEYESKFPNDLAPLYTGDGDKFVHVSSDTWPGANGTLGRTREQIEEAKRDHVQPQGGAGFACGELGAGVAAAAVGSLIGAHFGLELGGLLLDAVGDVEATAGSEQSKEDNDGENAEENLHDGIAAGSGDRRGCIGWSRSGRL